MEKVIRFCALLICTILLTQSAAAQLINYFHNVGETFVTTCALPSDSTRPYDRVQVVKDAGEIKDGILQLGTDLIIASVLRGQAVPNLDNVEGGRYNLIIDEADTYVVAFEISPVRHVDENRYWCYYTDETGGTNNVAVSLERNLFVRSPGAITLSSQVASTASTVITNANENAAESEVTVVDAFPVVFTCVVAAASPPATITWEVGGVPLQTGDSYNGATISLTHVESSTDFSGDAALNGLNDTTATLRFIPNYQLLDLVRCKSEQSWGVDPSEDVMTLSQQRLMVLKRPVLSFLVNLVNVSGTVDLVRGQATKITAVAAAAINDAAITIDESGITPLSDESTGSEVPSQNGVLFTSQRDFTFTPTSGNDGDSFSFTAVNDATSLADDTLTATLNFNLLTGPNSQLSYTNPTDGTAEGPIADPCNTDTKITVVEGEDLAITCRAENTDPFSVLSVYRGNGPPVSTGDIIIGASSNTDSNVNNNPDVTLDGSSYDTEITRQIVNPDFSMNGDIISCVARSTINSINYETVSCGALEFVVAPDSSGFTSSGANGVNLSGGTSSSSQSADIAESPLMFTCGAENSIPAATVQWFYTDNGGTRTEITSGFTTETTEPTPDDDKVDVTSTLNRAFTFADCGATIECRISHDGLNNDIVYQVSTLDLDVAPGVPTLIVDETSGNNKDIDLDATNEVAILMEKTEYNFDCTGLADPEAAITWVLYNTAGGTLDTETDSPTGEADDCDANSFTGKYRLTQMYNTHVNLQCGYITCTAKNAYGSESSTIYFQIWKVQEAATQGGVGIGLSYRILNNDDAFTDLTNEQEVNLFVGENYEFQCSVPNVSPVSPWPANIPTGAGTPIGPCNGLANVARDILNIDFYYGGANRDAGELGGDEDAVYVSASNDFTVTDQFEVATGGDCSRTLTCRADFNAVGFPASTSSAASGPFFTVTVIRVNTPSMTVLPLIMQTSPNTASYNQANDVLGTVSEVDLIASTTYVFNCRSEPANGPTDIIWNLLDNNGVFESQLDIDDIDNAVDCNTMGTENDDLSPGLSADFATHHSHILQCVNVNTFGSANSQILLRVFKNPDDVTMYVGGITGTDPPVPVGGAVLANPEYIADEGADMTFTCVATNAYRAAEVNWNLAGTGNLEDDTEVEWLDTSDDLYDTFATLGSYTYTAADCGMLLTCTTDHVDTSNTPAVRTDTTTLMVRVAVNSVAIYLQELIPAAISTDPGNHIDANRLLSTLSTLELIALHDREYVLQARTDTITPEAEFDWFLYNGDGTAIPGMPLLQDGARPTDVVCPASTDDDDFTWTADFDIHDNKRIRVTADNEHSDDAEEDYVLLNVQAEVLQNNIKMYVSSSPNQGPANDANLSELIDGVMYYMDCVVEEAVPDPTIMPILTGTTFTSITTNTQLPADVTSGILANRRLTASFSFTANHQTQCNEMLTCEAFNNANTLLNSYDTANPSTMSIAEQVQVLVPVDGVEISLLQLGSGAAALSAFPTTDLTVDQLLGSAAEVVVIHNMGYALQAATSNLVEHDADWDWDRTDSSDQVESNLQNTVSTGNVDCVAEIDEDPLNLPPIQFDTYNGKRIRATADNTGVSQDEYVQLDVRAEVKVGNMHMYVSTSPNTVSTEVDYTSIYYMEAGTTYYVDCVVEDAVPAPAITLDIDGGTAGIASATQNNVLSSVTSGILADRRSVESFTYVADKDNCGDILRFGAGNAANDLLNDFDGRDAILYREIEVHVAFGPGDPVLVLDPGNGNDDADDNNVAADVNGNTDAILIENVEYDFDCTVAALMSDPEANIRWRLYDSDDAQIGVDKLDSSGETEPDCTSNEFKGEYKLSADKVTFEDLQCGYLECTAINSVGESASVKITFQIWKLPSSSIGGDGIELSYKVMDAPDNTYTALTHGQDQDLTVGVTYTFRCIIRNISPVGSTPTPVGGPATGVCGAGLSSVARDVVNLDFYYHNDPRDDGISNDADEVATYNNGNGLYYLVDTYNRLILATDNCPANIVCRADVNLNGIPTPSTSDIPSITVPITRITGPTTPVLVMNPDEDNDGDGSNADAILLEATSYTFDCTSSADPDATFVWTLYDSTGTRVAGTQVVTFDSTEDNANCIVLPKTTMYTLDPSNVNAGLQCGYLECMVVHDGAPINGGVDNVRMTFQIWNVPKPDSMVLNFKEDGAPDASYAQVDDNEVIPFKDGDTYLFQCRVDDVFPVANIGAAGTVDVCPALSSEQGDVLNIDFFDKGTHDAGVQGSTEPAVYQNPYFELIDFYAYTVGTSDACPATFICSADHFPGFGDTADPMDSYIPSVTAVIHRIRPTDSAVISPPVFGLDSMRGSEDLGAGVNGVDRLTLYEGDIYEIICQSNGADPDNDIVWWLDEDCDAAIESGELLLVGFDATENFPDCVTQPEDPSEVSMWKRLTPDFAGYNDRCLRCVSGGLFDQYELDIWKPPSELIIYDGATDDDGDGLIGDADRLDDVVYVCTGEAFDFMVTAFAANPAVGGSSPFEPHDPFKIYLGLDNDADGLPDEASRTEIVDSPGSINVDNVLVGDIVDPSNPGGAGLFDSTARVEFLVGELMLANDNEKVASVCDPTFGVCDTFQLELVALPQEFGDTGSAVQLEVTDPFASDRTGNAPTSRILQNGQNPVRLHLDEEYEFTCSSKDARPAAEHLYTIQGGIGITPMNEMISPSPTEPGLPNTQLFDSSRKLRIRPTNFDATGREFCCTAQNAATRVLCEGTAGETGIRQQECVTLEIIDEPDEVIMSRLEVGGAGGGFEEIDTEAGYTTLKSNKLFNFRCEAFRSSAGVDIEWLFTPTATHSGYVLPFTPDQKNPLESPVNPLGGHYDTTSEIEFRTVDEVLGGVLQCCANHPAIPGGGGLEVEEDPNLSKICVNTTLIFPQPPRDVIIWKRPEKTPTNPYEDGNVVKANVDELLVLNCTALASIPESYIGWSATDLQGRQNANIRKSFHSSDCPAWIVDSDPRVIDPVLKTVDTTKCIQIVPTFDEHGLDVTCTAVHEANTTGISAFVKLDLCVPCHVNLKLADVVQENNQNEPASTGFTNGATVPFRRNRDTRKLSCLNTGARTEPNIKVYIVPLDAEAILLTPSNTESYDEYPTVSVYDANDPKYSADKYRQLFSARVDVELTVSQTHYTIDGATLSCVCTNSISNEGVSKAYINVTLAVFDQPPTEPKTSILVNGAPRVNIGSTSVLTTVVPQPAPQAPFNNELPEEDLTGDVPPITNRRKKRQILADDNSISCIARETKPAVNFIWKLDGEVISGDFIETEVTDSTTNVGVGLLDTTSTITFDPVHRAYHSKELCCELISSDLGSPIRRCTNLVVFTPPDSPLELTGSNVVNEGNTVQLQCMANEHYPGGVFQWDDEYGSVLLIDEAISATQLTVLPDYRLSQWSSYSFVASREHNGKTIVCGLEQNYDEGDIKYEASTTGEIEISVNFCPTTNAQITNCPAAPVVPGSDVTVSCQSAVTNPPARLDWYLNNVEQSPSGSSTTEPRDYGYVTIQNFRTRQLGLLDDGLQLQCCPTHLTQDIGCGQLCSGVCTIRVEQPPAERGCRWVRVQVTLENIYGNEALWHTDYSNTLSSAYRNLTSGLTDVFRQIFDGQEDYKSAIVATIRESADGRVQVIVGLEFDAPYRSTTEHIDQTLSQSTDGNGNLVYNDGNVSPYEIVLNSATVVCVCNDGYCARGPPCVPDEDFSSSCSCPANFAPPRCVDPLPPTDSTLPPPITGIKYGRLVFILGEIDNQAAIWNDKYDSLTDGDTQDLINGLDTALTNIYSPNFPCFQNVRIADLFEAEGGFIGVVAGVEFTREVGCDDTLDDVRTTFLENVDGDQRIGNSDYELDSDYLSETTAEEVCGDEFSCSNGGWCVPSDTLYYSSCQCPDGYAGSRCQTLIRLPSTTPDSIGVTKKTTPALSTTALIGIIIGVVLFAAILIGLLLLCCFLCGDRERVRTRVVYTDEDDKPPKRGYGTPPRNQYAEQNGTYPKRRGDAVDDWPWASDGRPPVAYNRDTFDINFDQRPSNGRMGPRPVF